MKTYSKRHRPPDKKDLDNVVVDGQTNQKTEERPRKRKRFVDQSAMPGAFETPHPTLEANSQVYKLPSTKPIPSSTPFSPVPITAPSQPLDLRPRSYFIPTTSGSLKENAGSICRKSSKTLSSFTLTAGSGPASRNIRENNKQTRSPSRSSNSASSRSRSSDQTRLSKFKARLIKKSKFKFKPNSTINDLNECHPSKSSTSRSKPFSKRNKSIRLVSNAEQTLLASPFASRAASPIDRPNLDIAKSGLNESMGPLAPAKLATLSRGFSNNKRGRPSKVCVAFSSPEKPGPRKRSSAKLPNRGPESTNENGFSWKNRRPSAPSNLQRPSRPVGKAHTPANRVTKTTDKHKQLDENEMNSHKSEHRTPALSRSVGPIKDWDNQLGIALNDNSNPFCWMQERSAVDFDRPPSQSSFHISSGFIHTEDDAEAVFWSSGEDNDGNNDELNQRVGANPEIVSALLTSTPYKNVLARRLSVPIVDSPSNTSPKSRVSTDASRNIDVSIAVKSREDIELTAPLEYPESCHKDSMSFQDHTPWITDSIISPPAAYSKSKVAAKFEEGVDQNVEKEEPIVFAEPGLKIPSPCSAILSSPFRYSYAESTSSVVESTSTGLRELAVGDQEPNEGTVTAGTEDKGFATVQPQGPPQRTRSGTIMAARNGPSIAMRTRTGTIVGPSIIGRTRSGTIVAKVKIPEQDVAAVGNRRTRSGSVVGPDPSGKKGVRWSAGSVAELEPTNIPNAASTEEGVHAILDGELTQINKCNGNGCESGIKEVNEAECYVDSLYLTSSPDPIDFLTGGKIDGDESTLVVAVGDWQVADGPPSPEMQKTIQMPRGMSSRSTTRRFKLNGHRRNRARFLGEVEGRESDNPTGNNLHFEDGLNDTSDDELLLIGGQSKSLFF